ncbi:MAG: trypsin-like peptidase domain-containing protein [Planctomycetaceae bacterium]|nr:trypsin-like peptidase domain-containing protein [Planctomycetaceae bacterium]
MRVMIACLACAIVGGMVSGIVVSISEPTQIVAQDKIERRGPGFPQLPLFQPSPKQPNQTPTDSPEDRYGESWLESDELTPDERVNVLVYKNVNRSVVNITTRNVKVDNFFLRAVPEEGTGSGVVVDRAGHIVTNYHVIEDVREVIVSMFDGESYDATFVGADPVNDIAVIRIEAPRESLHPVRFGDSSPLKVGMKVLAIGNPFGLERTLTTGIISSLNRSLQLHRDRNIKSIIQIDAAVNPGNSGGPVLDSHGRMIGMNTAIYSKTGQSSGVGFAIPVNLVKRVVPQLIRHGQVIRAEIGISRVYETENGLLIAKLTSDGPAESAGLLGPQVVRQRRGPFVVERMDKSAADLIIALDGTKITSAEDFRDEIEAHKPGETIVLTIIRADKELKIPVQLGGGKITSK